MKRSISITTVDTKNLLVIAFTLIALQILTATGLSLALNHNEVSTSSLTIYEDYVEILSGPQKHFKGWVRYYSDKPDLHNGIYKNLIFSTKYIPADLEGTDTDEPISGLKSISTFYVDQNNLKTLSSHVVMMGY